MQNTLFNHLFKLLGDSGVGKSNLLSRFSRGITIHRVIIDLGIFSEDFRSTIGVEFASKIVEVKDKKIRCQIWDTAGQERYRAITCSYYRGAVGSLLIYDISNRTTFEHLDLWARELRANTDPNSLIFVIGNKCDLADIRMVTAEEGQEYVTSNGLAGFAETSAKDDINVNTAFQNCIISIFDKLKEKNLLSDAALVQANRRAAIDIQAPPKESTSNCCSGIGTPSGRDEPSQAYFTNVKM